jgi:transposase
MVNSMLDTLIAKAGGLHLAVKAMVKHFHNAYKGHGIKELPDAFKRLIEKLQEDGTTEDRARSGRPPRITEEQVRHCLTYFKKGVGTGRKQWYGFTSIEHAAVECPEIAAVLAETGVHIDTLWGRMRDLQMQEHKHGFRKITIRVKPSLTPDIRQERLRKAAEWSRMSLEDLMCVFWIDEKQEYMLDKAYKCYAPDDAESYSVESHSPLGKAKKLKYIACVNAVLGPVYIALISGSSDFDSGFMVRTCVPSRRHVHPPTPLNPGPPCRFHDGQHVWHVILVNPQNVEPLLRSALAYALISLALLLGAAMTCPALLQREAPSPIKEDT